MEFIVIDNNTGEEADTYEIALKEQWADGLMYCDMDGFAIMQDGSLILMDECGQFRYCPEGRFTVAFREEELDKDKNDDFDYDQWYADLEEFVDDECGEKR